MSAGTWVRIGIILALVVVAALIGLDDLWRDDAD